MRKTAVWPALFLLPVIIIAVAAPAAPAAPAPIPWEKVARHLPPEVVRQIEDDGGAESVIDLTLSGERGYLKYIRPAAPGREARPISREVLLRQVGESIQARPSGPRANPNAFGRYWALGFPKSVQGNQVLVVPGHGADNVYLPLRVLAWPPRPESRRDSNRFLD